MLSVGQAHVILHVGKVPRPLQNEICVGEEHQIKIACKQSADLACIYYILPTCPRLFFCYRQTV